MKMIYKYSLNAKMINQDQPIALPRGANVLDVQFQGTDLTLWAEVDTDSPEQNYSFFIGFTGSSPPDSDHMVYLRTLQLQGFVFHIYMTQELRFGTGTTRGLF